MCIDAFIPIQRKKLKIACRRIIIFGIILTTNGIEINKQKIMNMMQWPRPTTEKGLQHLIGIWVWWRIFIPAFSQKIKTFYLALKMVKKTKKIGMDKLFRKSICWNV